MSENRKAPLTAAIAAAFLAGMIATAAEAAPKKTDTQADTNHPDIHTKVGQGPGNNANANPNGQADIHGIQNVPGQDNNNKPGGKGGFADSLADLVHGGIDDVNKVAAGTLP